MGLAERVLDFMPQVIRCWLGDVTRARPGSYWTAIAPPPIPVTTVLINPTAHSRVDRGGVISITTMAESNAPPTAAPPAALNAAAPATPLLVGSGTMTLQCKRPPKARASGGRVIEISCG
jgi:hypothetical protein